jgi:hypothetical protein
MLPAKTRRPAQMSSELAGRVLKAKNLLPLDALGEMDIRDSSRAGSQAPNAPPALTFGLPGKQKVKRLRTRRFLISSARGLPQNLKNFTY